MTCPKELRSVPEPSFTEQKQIGHAMPPAAGRAWASSASWKILRATGILTGFSGVVLAATVARELVTASYFGRSDAVDAYLIAYVVPSFVVGIVAYSFNLALIPVFVEVRQREGPTAAQRLFSGAMVWSLGLLVAVVLLLAALAPWYLPLLGSGFSASKLLLTRHLLYVMLPLIALTGITSNGTAVLNAGERFALPGALPVLPPLAAFAFVILLGKSWSVYSLAAGTVVGTALQAAMLAWVARAHGIDLTPRWYGVDPKLRMVISQYLPMMAGALLLGTTDLVDQSMAAMLPGGSVAAFGYARKIVSVLVVVGALPLGAASLPYFSEMAAKEAWDACRHTLRTVGGVILLVTVPVTAGLVLFAHPLVRLLFERGAFTPHDTAVVSRVEAWLALQIPFYLLCILGLRVVSALKRNAVLTGIAAFTTTLNVVLNLLLMRVYGVAGIALSTSIVYFVCALLIFVAIYALIRRNQARAPAGAGI
jgi:putative peptidoglycan lipid II flippase